MRKIIAANWKMHKTRTEASKCAAEIAISLENNPLPPDRLGVIFPPFTDIATVAAALACAGGMAVGAQNFYPAMEGAFTGEISTRMLADAGASWLLAGHSERRSIFGETDAMIAEKIGFGLGQGFNLMLCVGETLAQREAGRLEDVLRGQLSGALGALAAQGKDLSARMAIAYEPVWAIGTGKVAGDAEIADAHALARRILCDLLGSDGDRLPVLYGGSVKPDNAGRLLALDNVDGLLVGGASLMADSFLDILRSHPMDDFQGKTRAGAAR